MGSRTLDARLDAVRAELEFLTSRIAAAKQLKEHEAATGWETWGRNSDAAFSFAVRRQLRGHFGKVYALDWGGDSSSLVSASQDGKLIVWNAFTENKQEAISLKSAWVMACAFEREEQRYVASGGLDNVCTVHDLRSPSMPAYELVGHAGYLSSCRWIGASHMLTGSGDGTCALWDTERGLRVQSFAEHTADVMSVSTHPETPHVFASGSCDATVKIWDVRVGGCVRTFTGHLSDVNAVEFGPTGNVVGSGSDDASCRIFDLRSLGPLNVFNDDSISCGVTDVCFSKTGRLLFCSYEENFAIGWETCSAAGVFHELKTHKNRVSCLGINATGQALATGSWDTSLAIWA